MSGSGDFKFLLVRYERLPIFCFHCGMLGHGDRECTIIKKVVKDNVSNPQRQYGIWMRAGSPQKKQFGRGWKEEFNNTKRGTGQGTTDEESEGQSTRRRNPTSLDGTARDTNRADGSRSWKPETGGCNQEESDLSKSYQIEGEKAKEQSHVSKSLTEYEEKLQARTAEKGKRTVQVEPGEWRQTVLPGEEDNALPTNTEIEEIGESQEPMDAEATNMQELILVRTASKLTPVNHAVEKQGEKVCPDITKKGGSINHNRWKKKARRVFSRRAGPANPIVGSKRGPPLTSLEVQDVSKKSKGPSSSDPKVVMSKADVGSAGLEMSKACREQ